MSNPPRVNASLAKELRREHEAYDARLKETAYEGRQPDTRAFIPPDEDLELPDGSVYSAASMVEWAQPDRLGRRLLALSDEVYRFNTRTVHATVDGAAAKVGHEAVEFVKAPSMDEARDLLITLLGWVRLAGFTEEQLVQAARAKMDVNFERTWVRMPDGSYQHTPDGTS